MRWKLRTEDGLKVARFDREALVFNPLSWQTHLLNDSALRGLEALRSGPRSLDEVLAVIHGDPLPELWSVELQMGEALLGELETLGLVIKIDPVAPCE